MTENIHIAIIGAGIVSLCLARGLSKHKHIKFRIYESRSELGQDSSGFGIGANGQTAMRLIDSDLLTSLDNAGAVSSPGLRFMVGTGPDAGQEISSQSFATPVKTVRRSALLQELRASLLPETLQLGRQLVSIEDGPAQTKFLVFEDGERVQVDAIIGCDGVNSNVRRHVLGPDHPATDAQWSTGYNTRIMVPMKQAVAIFGQEYCTGLAASGWQTGWIGEGGFCMTDFEDGSDTMQVIAGGNKNEVIDAIYGRPLVQVDKEFWTSRLREWGWIGNKISVVVEKQGTHFTATRRGHISTPFYNKGVTCLAGDAARTFPPFRGAGAGQGMEDAMMLAAVLGEARRRSDIVSAFQIYNDFRQPRREAVADESVRAGYFLLGNAGLDKEFLAEQCANWNDWIFSFDLEKQVKEATAQTRQYAQKSAEP